MLLLHISLLYTFLLIELHDESETLVVDGDHLRPTLACKVTYIIACLFKG